MAGKTTKPKTLHVISIPNYLYGFESAADIAAIMRLLDKGLALKFRENARGVTDTREESRVTVEMNYPYHPLGEALALPERGTHPALYDPKLA